MASWVVVIHEVDDYDLWKQAFDEAAPLRRAGGERSFQVLLDPSAPSRVVHLAQWSSTSDAKAFFESEQVQQIRERAGVHAPTFLYLDELDRGQL